MSDNEKPNDHAGRVTLDHNVDANDMVSRQSNMFYFKIGLENLINKHSIDSWAKVPDFILAQYILDCLNAVRLLTDSRDNYYLDDDKRETK